MFTINKLTDGSLNYLKLTKADSLSFVVEVYNPTDNQPYQFKQGDKITLLVKRFYSDQNALMQVDGNIISNTNIATFNLGGVDTNSLTYGGYIMQIVLLKTNGEKHTIVNPCIDKNGHELNNFIVCQSLDDNIQGTPPTIQPNARNISQSSSGIIKGMLNYPEQISTGGVDDHNKLQNLEYDKSGHINFAKSPDSRLLTNDKELYGAINELYNKANQIKLPYELDGGTPFSDMSKAIDLNGGEYNTIYDKDRVIDGGNVK